MFSKCDGPSVNVNGNASTSLTFERLDMEDSDEKNATLAKSGRGLRAFSDKDRNTPNSTDAKNSNGTATNKPRNTKTKSSNGNNNTRSSDDVTKTICSLIDVKNLNCNKYNNGATLVKN